MASDLISMGTAQYEHDLTTAQIAAAKGTLTSLAPDASPGTREGFACAMLRRHGYTPPAGRLAAWNEYKRLLESGTIK